MRSRTNRPGAQLSDLAFLLILFFILLIGVMSLAQLELVLTKEPAESLPDEQQETLHILVHNHGGWSIEGDPVDQQFLQQLLDSGIKHVRISIEEGSVWQSVLTLLDITQRSQARSVFLEGSW